MARTDLTREKHRASTDRIKLYDLVDGEVVAHVGVVTEDGPLVLPTAIARDRDHLLLHGSVASRWMRLTRKGASIAVTVTHMDGVIVARTSFESSIRYRSAVIFGTPILIGDRDKERALDVLVDKLIPGRRTEIRRPSAQELAQTMVLSLPIEEWSLKISDGWPADSDEDRQSPVWAGVVLLQSAPGQIEAAPDLSLGIDIPASVQALAVAPSANPQLQ